MITTSVNQRESLVDQYLAQVKTELVRALRKYPAHPSLEHSLAVLREEYLELEQEVFRQHGARSSDALRTEATQVAAMATRLMLELDARGSAVAEVNTSMPIKAWWCKLTGSHDYDLVETYDLSFGRGLKVQAEFYQCKRCGERSRKLIGTGYVDGETFSTILSGGASSLTPPNSTDTISAVLDKWGGSVDIVTTTPAPADAPATPTFKRRRRKPKNPQA